MTCESGLGHSFHFLALQHIVQLKNLKHRLQCIRHSVVNVCCVVLLMAHHWCTGTLKYTVHVFSKVFLTFKVWKSVHHHTIQINQPTRCNNFSSLLLDVYVQLNMFRASLHPSSGAQQMQMQPLVLPFERGGSSAVGRCQAGRPAQPRPTALLTPRSNGKTRRCYCSCWTPDDGCKDARNMLSCT